MLLLEAFLVVVQLAVFAAVTVFLFKNLIWITSGYLDVPFVRTPPHYAEIVNAALAVEPGDTVYELGSGDGRFMLAMASLMPGAKFVGIEHNLWLHLYALVRKRLAHNPGNVQFLRGDFYTTDFAPANKMYAYLLDTVMFQLQPKFDQQFKGRIASRAFPFPKKPLSNVVELSEHVGAHGQHLLFVYDF